jgi:hypothetical protein
MGLKSPDAVWLAATFEFGDSTSSACKYLADLFQLSDNGHIGGRNMTTLRLGWAERRPQPVACCVYILRNLCHYS